MLWYNFALTFDSMGISSWVNYTLVWYSFIQQYTYKHSLSRKYDGCGWMIFLVWLLEKSYFLSWVDTSIIVFSSSIKNNLSAINSCWESHKRIFTIFNSLLMCLIRKFPLSEYGPMIFSLDHSVSWAIRLHLTTSSSNFCSLQTQNYENINILKSLKCWQ